MITETYKFGQFTHKLKPFDHQAVGFEISKDREHYALFWEMGVGKTKPIIDTAAHLFLKGEIDGVIVISDKGAYRNWTDYEIPIHMMSGIPMRSIAWGSGMNSTERRATEELIKAKDDVLDIVAMNVEAFSSENALEYAKRFLASHYTMIVIDESTSIKNPESKRTKNILSLRDLCQYRRILTGTPMGNGPMDLYSQFEFLKPGLLMFESFVAFRSYYAEMLLTKVPGRPKPYYQILGYRNLEILAKIIEPNSSRLLKTQCLDLPDKVYETHYVEHTPEQAKAYQDIKTLALTELEQGLVTAVSALAAMTKLHQINCGHVKLDGKDGAEVPINSNRVNELLNLTRLIDAKIIIWSIFRYDIREIMRVLTEEYGPRAAVHYYGQTTDDQRVEAIKRFRTEKECRFFVSNQSTGGKGITLVEATYNIYYSNSFNLIHRLQSEDRNHRPGQTMKCTNIDMVVPKTIDVKVVGSLKNKKDIASNVLDVFREMIT